MEEHHPSFKLGRQLRLISLRAIIFVFAEITIIIHDRAKSTAGALYSFVRKDYSHRHSEDEKGKNRKC